MLKDVLDRFLLSCEMDPGLKEFARRFPLSLGFYITDQSLEFLLSFQDAAVQATWGIPPGKAEFTVRMDAETWDGIMTGRIDGSVAYMRGKLKLSGDMMKAMAMQKITRDLIRLYTQARNEIGDPFQG